jgi:hypothetical protein
VRRARLSLAAQRGHQSGGNKRQRCASPMEFGRHSEAAAQMTTPRRSIITTETCAVYRRARSGGEIPPAVCWRMTLAPRSMMGIPS